MKKEGRESHTSGRRKSGSGKKPERSVRGQRSGKSRDRQQTPKGGGVHALGRKPAEKRVFSGAKRKSNSVLKRVEGKRYLTFVRTSAKRGHTDLDNLETKRERKIEDYFDGRFSLFFKKVL